MKTIQQTVEVNFNAIEIKDAVIMAPLMNELKKTINSKIARQMYLKMSEEEQSKYNKIYTERTYIADNEEAIFEILSKLGFVTTNDNESAEKILESYRK